MSSSAYAGGSPQASGFTYQGVLKSGGVPVNGFHTIRFRLYDAHEGGTLLPPTQAFGMLVVDGLVTVTVAWNDQFTGNARWLEISVRGPGEPDYTVLSPRQRITSVPYAEQAMSAASLRALDSQPLTLQTGGADRLTITQDGNVGIGTTTPTAGLEINRGATNDTALRVSSSGLGWGSGIRFANTDAIAPNGREYGIYSDPNGIFHFSDNFAGVTRLAIGPSGNIGIGTVAPGFQLQLSTDSAAKPGTNTWTISSDERLKRDIAPLEDSLERLLKLRGVTFRWINPDSQGGRTGVETGLIAQEVENVFPEWVGTDNHGFKTLTIGGFEALTAEALRELRAEKDAEIAALRAAHDSLQSANATLSREVAELRELVERMIAEK